jgi:hypothetical protein
LRQNFSPIAKAQGKTFLVCQYLNKASHPNLKSSERYYFVSATSVALVVAVVDASTTTSLDEFDGTVWSTLAFEQDIITAPARMTRVIESLLDLRAVFPFNWSEIYVSRKSSVRTEKSE